MRFLRALAIGVLSILIVIAIAAAVSGFLWLGADKPPKIDGKGLVLEFELKIPPAIQIPEELNDYTIGASLYANNKDNRYASIDLKSITPSQGKRNLVRLDTGNPARRSYSRSRA